MPKRNKYISLTNYLLKSGEDEISLSLEQIAGIVGGLPQSAYDYPALWYSGHGGPLSVSWVNAGYTTRLNWKAQKVMFTKNTCHKNKAVRKYVPEQPKFTASLDIETAIMKIRRYHDTTADKTHTRFRSWEHCYKAFQENRHMPDKVEFLCLHLAWYLASWGMLRNSFLLNHDYLVHKDVVCELTSGKYEPLFSNEPTSETISLTLEASKAIIKAYPGNSVTTTLITKILLGVFGCAPAYDRFFREAAIKYNVCGGQWGERSLRLLWLYYEHHREAFEKLRHDIILDGFLYPPMKLLDMCLWQIGYDESPQRDE